MTKCKLSPVALGLAFGSLGVLAVIILAIATFVGYESNVIQMLHKMHEGVDKTLAGFVIAGVISFVNGFVHGFLIGWLYNVFANCCCKGKTHCAE